MKSLLLNPPKKQKNKWMKGFFIPKTDKTIVLHDQHQHSHLPGTKSIKSKGARNA